MSSMNYQEIVDIVNQALVVDVEVVETRCADTTRIKNIDD